MSIRFNEEHIPDSPFVVPVASPSDDARRLTVASLQVRLRERQTFVHPKQLQVNPWHSSCNEIENSSHDMKQSLICCNVRYQVQTEKER